MSIKNKTSLSQRIANITADIDHSNDMQVSGRLTRVVGLTLEAVGLNVPLGSKCLIYSECDKTLEAEVIGFGNEALYLMTTDDTHGIKPGAKIVACGGNADARVGEQLLGRVLDGAGKPIDDLGPLQTDAIYPLLGKPINPLSRKTISEPLDVGIRSINGLLTVGVGQRIGLFAGSGVGKSVLLGMMTCFTKADVIVVGLVGERGREVKEFIEHNLGEAGLKRSVVVAAPADTSPLMRLHGGMLATTIAEYFRDRGANVLLLLDSLTRFAQAQRQIGLSIGELPATKGYPPSVFSKLSQLVERAGNASEGGGSITAFYTVLAEGDDQQDPIADAARSILDGHIVLSRSLAESGIYPAIDVEASISRVANAITPDEQQALVREFKYLNAKYSQNRDLINVGAYAQGADPDLDRAIQLYPQMRQYVMQGMAENIDYQQSWSGLTSLFAPDSGPVT